MKTPAPSEVREMTDADCVSYGIDRADYPADKLWLAIWPDRSGYYTEGTDNPEPEARFCVTVFNESEIFSNAEDAQAWLFQRLEKTVGGYDYNAGYQSAAGYRN